MRHQFTSRLRRVLDSDSAYRLLPNGTWLAGGCWPLARALRTALGSGAVLRVVTSLPADHGELARMPQHVVVQCGDLWLDGAGVSTRNGLLQRMRLGERLLAPRLESFSAAAVRQVGIWEGRRCAAGLVLLFQRHLPEARALLDGTGTRAAARL